LKETTPTSRIAKTSRNRGLKQYHVRITSSRFNWSKHAATMRTGYELRAGRNLVVSLFSPLKLIKFIDQFEAEIGSLAELLEREKKKSETLEKQLGELHDQHETQQYFATLYKVGFQFPRVSNFPFSLKFARKKMSSKTRRLTSKLLTAEYSSWSRRRPR
jgi:hypothetical protein